MSKNKNNSNANNSGVDIDTQLAALETQRAGLLKQKQESELTRINAIAGKIDELPKHLGVDNLEMVAVMVRQRIKGTFGSIVTDVAARPRTVLTKEQRTLIGERLKVGGPGNQRSEIATEFGIHTQTVQNIAGECGLVRSRNGNPTVASVAAALAPKPSDARAASVATEAIAPAVAA